MSLRKQAELSQNKDLLLRVASAVASRGAIDPVGWASTRLWTLAASDGWVEAYIASQETPTDDSEDLGVTDQMIQDAITVALTLEPLHIPE